MDWYSCNSKKSDFGFGHFGLVEQFWGSLGGNLGSGSMLNSHTLVLDGEKGELVKAPGGVEKKDGVLEVKDVAALKSHSEAERRRRERINAHLDTLRGLVPCAGKMDKATLLAEVICQVKQLKNSATEASKGVLIPMDADEVRVEPLDESSRDGTYFLASLCCDYNPELLSEVKNALNALQLNIVKAEISTLGKRVKNVFVFTSGRGNGNAEEQQLLLNLVRQALSSIVDKISVCMEYSPRTLLPNKRRRISFFESSSSSS